MKFQTFNTKFLKVQYSGTNIEQILTCYI